MRKKVRVGILGGYHRGNSMLRYCSCADNAEVVAICDRNPDVLREQREKLQDGSISFYDSFDAFIGHDMDAVILANYATEHAPFAIRALERGLHVFSEVLPCQTMKEAVELVEAVESSGRVYAYGENYCYMQAPMEMKRLYREGKIGDFEYGECEYIHNGEPIWASITCGDRNHWRNRMYSTFYCTHSLGPILHITGLRPVSVTGFEGTKTERNLRTGKRSGQFGMVLQDSWLFEGTIRENICYGNEETSEEAMIEACKAANVHHFIMSLPGGYNMVLNEEANISQGQRQLLTIARAMVDNAPMLILDEATSSVDTRTEQNIQEAMDRLMKGRTSFVIAHRLSTIKNADLILVMKNGNIIEQGNHEQLMAQGGFYSELYNSQFSKHGAAEEED